MKQPDVHTRGKRNVITLLPTPRLSGLLCTRCGTRGVTVWVSWIDQMAVEHEATWCTPVCATVDGWPWMRAAKRAAR